MTTAAGAMVGLARQTLNTVLPARCLVCRVSIEEGGALCGPCWSRLTFLGPPLCRCCGHPFEHAVPGDPLCGACLRRRPAYDRARAALLYDEASRPLILGFKHADETHAAPAFGRWMARAGTELLAAADLVVPVPLHRWRLFARRYNQAALLARALARETGLAVAVDLLVRHRKTPPQGRLAPALRWRNVRGAFAVRRRWRGKIAGRRVLLVDDVLTTGATAEACAATLKYAGAGAVDVLALARVPRPR